MTVRNGARVPRTPLLYIVAGFAGGVIISRNAAPMDNAETSGVVLALLVGGFILWRAGYKGKSEAVATAVATAVASAVAQAESHSQAVAQQAVTLVLASEGRIPHPVDGYDSDVFTAVDSVQDAHGIIARDARHELVQQRRSPERVTDSATG